MSSDNNNNTTQLSSKILPDDNSSDHKTLVKIAQQSLALIKFTIRRGAFQLEELPEILEFSKELETIVKTKPSLTFQV